MAAPIWPCLFLLRTAAAPAGKNLPPSPPALLPPLVPSVAAAALSAAAASLSLLASAARSCRSSKVVPATRHSEVRLMRGAKDGGRGVA